ncbi:hypothetical protein [Leptolyngbya iicbica]|uniref:BON domain-containing protein n=3 Tax=Cyanophyceae TaxID=3028117 RepID=A0A4Q7E3K2_9CYAN|nr:hypothetical protein DYY88_17620 [Leptolyngbya sp. LK]
MGIYQCKHMTHAESLEPADPLPFEWAKAFPSWFQTPPPERIGLQGEYDYHGLQKRVEAVFSQQFVPSELERLTVSQRGRVVILQGVVSDHAMLRELVSLAKQVEGTYRVETAWVTCTAEQNLMMAI